MINLFNIFDKYLVYSEFSSNHSVFSSVVIFIMQDFFCSSILLKKSSNACLLPSLPKKVFIPSSTCLILLESKLKTSFLSISLSPLLLGIIQQSIALKNKPALFIPSFIVPESHSKRTSSISCSSVKVLILSIPKISANVKRWYSPLQRLAKYFAIAFIWLIFLDISIKQNYMLIILGMFRRPFLNLLIIDGSTLIALANLMFEVCVTDNKNTNLSAKFIISPLL